MKRLENVLKRLEEANLKLKISKSEFLQNQVEFLGFTFNENGIKPNNKKINAIINMPNPHNASTVKSFTNSVSFYRRFIPGLSRIAHPLFQLTKKDARFVWDEKCENAIKEIKKKLASAPFLVNPNFNEPFILHTDASIEGIGCEVSQSHGFIGATSRTLTSAERNYSTTEREALAITFGLKYFKHLFFGHKVIIYTDHQALVTARKIKDPDETRIGKLFMKLSQIDYEIRFKPGKENAAADCLSRLPLQAETNNISINTNDLVTESFIQDMVKQLFQFCQDKTNSTNNNNIQLNSFTIERTNWSIEQDKDTDTKFQIYISGQICSTKSKITFKHASTVKLTRKQKMSNKIYYQL